MEQPRCWYSLIQNYYLIAWLDSRQHRIGIFVMIYLFIFYVPGKISSWIDLDSEDEILRIDSETTLKQEIAWASHLSLQVYIVLLWQYSCLSYIIVCSKMNLYAVMLLILLFYLSKYMPSGVFIMSCSPCFLNSLIFKAFNGLLAV